MTPNVESISASDSVRQAARMMRDLDVGMLPVQDGKSLVGTLTDRDIAIRALTDSKDPASTLVGDIMTQEVLYGYEDDDTTSAVTTMENGQVRRLLVMDHELHCVGILSLGDIALRGQDPKLSEELLERVSEPSS